MLLHHSLFLYLQIIATLPVISNLDLLAEANVLFKMPTDRVQMEMNTLGTAQINVRWTGPSKVEFYLVLYKMETICPMTKKSLDPKTI